MGCLKCGGKNWQTICSGVKALYNGKEVIVSVFKCKNCNSISPRVEDVQVYCQWMNQK